MHAHPDDESSHTGGTIARYCAEGAQVTLVTCTLGEEGENVSAELVHLKPGETMAAHRLDELHDAARALGLTDYVRLGGDGRYHDSGMVSTAEGIASARQDTSETAFWHADLLEASLALVEVIRDRRPQIVVTYDPFGMYGHPDHVQAHRVATYAAALASARYRLDLGEPWQISRLLWVTYGAHDMLVVLRLAQEQGIDLGWSVPEGEQEPPPMVTPQDRVAVRVPIAPYGPQKSAALRSHRSQVNVEEPFWKLMEASYDVAGESYVLASGLPYPDGADDLFAGLELSPG